MDTTQKILDAFMADSEIYPLIRRFYEEKQISVRRTEAEICISDAADHGYQIIYLLHGTVRAVCLSPRGRRILLDEIGAGEFTGHISRLRGYSFNSSLIARTDCVYLSFPDKVFLELMKDPDFALQFYQSTSTRTYYMFQKFLSLTLFSTEENTAMYFLVHEKCLQQSTLDTISEEVGISRRSLYYILKKWQKEGILTKKGPCYLLADKDALLSLTEHIRLFYHEPF